MAKILALTDLHLTGGGERIIGLDPLARFRETLDHAVRHHGDADRMILMGDLTHNGRPAAYRDLKAALSDVPMPITWMLGNHDDRAAFLEVFPEAAVTGTGHVQEAIDLDGCRILTLDTLDGPPYYEDHHGGLLCAERLAWLDRHLRPGPTVVFTHHPAVPVGLPGMDAIRLANGEALLSRLADLGPVHLFSGHIHRTIAGSTRGLPWTVFKSTCHQAPLDLGTADSALSVSEPSGYGVILLDGPEVIVHHADVLPDAPPVARASRSA